ncbi:MAG TPA: hypothetical protein VMR50_05880 [Myxococcota bacterium]|nr:hypothetical protein [Myxococcota bacterium]
MAAAACHTGSGPSNSGSGPSSSGGGAVDELGLRVPEGWKETPKDMAGMRTFEFHPTSGPDFAVRVTSVRAGGGQPRDWVDAARTQVKPQSLEPNPPLESLCPDPNVGSYFSVTDRNLAAPGSTPGPDDWRYMTQGAFRRGSQGITFTVFSNGPEGQPKEKALAMIRELACAPQSAAAPSVLERDLRVPAAGWVAHLSLPGFEFERDGELDVGGQMLQASNPETGFELSAFSMQQADSPSSEQCRDRVWTPIETKFAHDYKSEARTLQSGEWAVGELNTPAQGKVYKSWHAFRGLERGCFEMHLSALGNVPDSDFAALLAAASFR